MRIFKCLLVFSIFPLFSGCQVFGPDRLQHFSTDGCSLFPEGTHRHKDLWHQCCTEHDKKYWVGGSYDERMNADLALRTCVQSVGQPSIADLMLAGVRVGGSPWWPSSFRWGYGWPYTHGYRVLTLQELEQVRKQKEGQDSN